MMSDSRKRQLIKTLVIMFGCGFSLGVILTYSILKG